MNGLRHGLGVYRWNYKDVLYIGKYRKGKKHGKGLFLKPEGDVFLVEYEKGVLIVDNQPATKDDMIRNIPDSILPSIPSWACLDNDSDIMDATTELAITKLLARLFNHANDKIDASSFERILAMDD